MTCPQGTRCPGLRRRAPRPRPHSRSRPPPSAPPSRRPARARRLASSLPGRCPACAGVTEARLGTGSDPGGSAFKVWATWSSIWGSWRLDQTVLGPWADSRVSGAEQGRALLPRCPEPRSALPPTPGSGRFPESLCAAGECRGDPRPPWSGLEGTREPVMRSRCAFCLWACRCLRRGSRSSLLSLTPVALVAVLLPEESCLAGDFWGPLTIPF